jgi:hypothetical protein
VIAGSGISYVGKSIKTIVFAETPFTCFSIIDPSRFILGDASGFIHLLALESDGTAGTVKDLKIEKLGEVPFFFILQNFYNRLAFPIL